MRLGVRCREGIASAQAGGRSVISGCGGCRRGLAVCVSLIRIKIVELP